MWGGPPGPQPTPSSALLLIALVEPHDAVSLAPRQRGPRTDRVQSLVGLAVADGSAGGPVLYQLRSHLCGGLRRCRRGSIAAHWSLGSHVQRLRTGCRFFTAICGDPSC